MKDVRLQTSADAENLELKPLIPASGLDLTTNSFGPEYSLRDDCRMTIINKRELTDTNFGDGGPSWALFINGETTAATAASAGAQHLYALPHIATGDLPFKGIDMDSVAVESMASMEPDGLPPQYVPTVISPQVNDIGNPRWELPIRSAGILEGFRLSGTDHREQANIQGWLFLGSGFAGVAGGGLIWLFSSLGALRRKTRPQAPHPASETDALKLDVAGGDDYPRPTTYKRLLVASVLSGIGGFALTWFLSRRRS